MLKVPLAVVGLGSRIGAADQHREITEIGEAAHRNAGAGPVLHRLHAGLEIEADGLRRRQCLQERRLADTWWSEDGERRLDVGRRESLLGGDNAQSLHGKGPCSGAIEFERYGGALTGCRRQTLPAH